MKTALDYIVETGCRNIDAAVEGVIDRLAPAGLKICNYPACKCPFDMGPDNRCLQGYKQPLA